jgi:hypothetical protein
MLPFILLLHQRTKGSLEEWQQASGNGVAREDIVGNWERSEVDQGSKVGVR